MKAPTVEVDADVSVDVKAPTVEVYTVVSVDVDSLLVEVYAVVSVGVEAPAVEVDARTLISLWTRVYQWMWRHQQWRLGHHTEY